MSKVNAEWHLANKMPKNPTTDQRINMKKYTIILLILAIFFGIFLIVYGEKDDSPGAQFLGLIIVVTSIIKIFKRKFKKNETSKVKNNNQQ